MTVAPPGGSFEDRFRRHARSADAFGSAAAVIVAVSGGLDSMTLLYLLRFCGGLPPGAELHAAHFDHRMRAGSAEDASWVAAVCREWAVDARLAAAPAPVRTEAGGREVRYRFLEDARLAAGVSAVVATAHTADDQAETVLFRIARGSGPAGLAGVLPRRAPGIVRPLLPFRRSEVRAFAQDRGVPFRDDPSNRDPRWTRNLLRRSVLPVLEKAVPGAAAALASHAEAALGQARALDELLDERIAGLAAKPETRRVSRPPGCAGARAVPANPGAAARPVAQPPLPAELSLDRKALAALSEPVLALVLRRAAFRTGAVLGRRAAAALGRFVRHAQSGRRFTLPGGAAAEHRLGRIVFRPPPPAAAAPSPAAAAPSLPSRPAVHAARRRSDPPGVLVAREPGEGSYVHGGVRVDVAWGPARRRGFPHVARFRVADVSFPMIVRPWAPGDRATMPYGKKKVKKLLLEARIPTCDRPGLPVLALPGGGPVLWVPGAAGGVQPAPRGRGASSPWYVHVRSCVVP